MHRLNDGGCTVFATFLEWPITDHRNIYCTFINQICLVNRSLKWLSSMIQVYVFACLTYQGIQTCSFLAGAR